MGSLPPQGSGGGGIDVTGSLGAMIYFDGNDWVALAVSTNGKILKIVGGIPSWQDAPSSEVTALTDLSDVTITTPSTGQVLRKSGSDWVNATLVKADISDFAHTHLAGDLPANIVYNNQANTYTGGGTQDFGGATLDNVGILISNASNPATTGVIRLGNNERITARNSGNTADIPILYVDTSSDTYINAGSGELLALSVNGSAQVAFSAGQAAWTADVFSTYGSNTSSTGTLRFGNAATLGWRNAANSANFTLTVNSSDILESTAPIQFTTYVRNNGTVASSGAIRLGATQLIAWRNNGNTNDNWIQTNSSDEFVFAISGLAEMGITSTAINLSNNNLIVNSGASVSSAGRIRLLNNDSIGWRNNAGTGDLLLVANTSDVLTYNGTAISLAGHTHPQSDITNLVSDLASKYSATNRQTNIINSEIDAAANIDKSKISTTGTWAVADIPTLTRAKISDFLPITTTDISDDNVTFAKIQNITTSRILGRTTALSGDIEELTASSVKTLLSIVKADISDFAHQSSHQSGGSDALTGLLDATARVAVRKNTGGADVGARRRLNFIEGSNVTLTIADDGAGEEVDITIAASSSGLSDGDKGDITVSSGGTVWTIDNDVVTFAKMQNIATDRILGRDTAASGDIEELTVGGGIEFTGAGGIQTSAFTGDVTKSAGGTALTIGTNKVLDTMIRQSAGVSVIGRSANTTGNVADIIAGADDTILRRTASALDFGQLTIGMFPANLVTFAKFQTIATDSLLGRDTTGTGNVENILLNATLEMDGSGNLRRAALTGDVTASAGSNSTTIPNNTVTYAKMQDISATNRILGRITAGAGDTEELTAANVKTILALVMADISDLSPSTIVRNNQSNTYSGAGTQDFTGSTLDNIGVLISNATNPSSGGVVRLGNTELISWRNAANSADHDFGLNASDQFAIRFSAANEYTFSSTEADWLGNNLRNVGFFEDNATNPSTTGVIRLGNNTSIGWRNAANSADLLLTVNASNILQFGGTSISLAGHTHVLTDVTDVTMTVANLNSLDDGVNSTLHFHDSDRARANHTGTQTRSTISDFAHQSTHQSGGSDALTGNLDATARTTVRKNTGADVGSRRRLNFIEGTNVTMTITDDAGSEEVDITINSSGGAGSGTDEVLLIPTTNKTIPDNTSIIIGDYYTLGSTVELQINSGANLTIV